MGDVRHSRWPWPVWAVAGGLSLIAPLLHCWILYAPPPGYVPTRLHTLEEVAAEGAGVLFRVRREAAP